jgi:DNA primase
MSRIPQHIIDDILQTARIEEVVGEFVQLKRAGSNLKGLSPFTDERTPSFIVSPGKQIFKCFSSGKGGSVVTFLMEREHFSYPEALKWLAQKYGIDIPEERQLTAEEQARLTEKDSLFIINEFARNHFHDRMLKHPEGQAVGLSYFEERGFRRDIIELFQLGYCLNSSDDFVKSASEKGYKKEYLEQVGLVKSKDGRSFDFFRGRVMFPIHSISGRVLGFGGRTLQTDKKIAKYFNSPESVVYNKSQILYGLFFSKNEIIKNDNCYLCEGYTDVISLYQSDIKNVVASSGTALTKEQIQLIRRYTANITILYDGDAAGIRASFRGIDLILEEGMNVKVVLFPDGEDPDSFARSNSSSDLKDFLANKQQDFVSFKANILLKGSENDPIQRAKLIREVMHSVSLIPDQITRGVYAQEIAKEFSFSEEVIHSELIKLRKQALARQYGEPEIVEVKTHDIPVLQPRSDENKVDLDKEYEFELIRLMVLYGSIMVEVENISEEGKKMQVEASVVELIQHEIEKDELYFVTPEYMKIYQIFVQGISENVIYTSSYFKRMEDQKMVQLVSDIESQQHECSVNWLIQHNMVTRTELDRLTESVNHALMRFKMHRVKRLIAKIQLQIQQDEQLSDEQLSSLLMEQIAYERIKMSFSKRLGRIILPE